MKNNDDFIYKLIDRHEKGRYFLTINYLNLDHPPTV